MIYGIDFDGTIVEEKFPAIGKPIGSTIDFIRELQAEGHKWILITMREGKYLDDAVAWLREHHLYPDAVNDNLPERVEMWGNNPRKVYADIYIDDHNAGGIHLPEIEQSKEDMLKKSEKLSNKTCGECKFFNKKRCEKWGGISIDDCPACCRFEPKAITNGDKIKQGGNRAIAKFAYKTARTNICGVCAFSTIEQGRYVCTAKGDSSCVDGIEAWLNAPAESEGKDGRA